MRTAQRRGGVQGVVSVLIASVPQALLTRTFAFRLWPDLARLGLSWGTWYAQVVTIGLVSVIASTAALRVLRGRRLMAQASLGPAVLVPGPATMLRGDVLALQMEDHYVRIHTPSGSEPVLMPLGRAIEAMSSIEGLRTHRSW